MPLHALHYVLLTALLLSPISSPAKDHGDYVDDPKVLTRIIQGLENSKVDELTSSKSTQDGKHYSYHLKSANYLGTISWKGKTLTLAAVKFIRSSAKDSEYPPARGHGFIVLFDATFKVVSCARIEESEYRLSGEELKRGETVIVDFSNHDERTRYKGYLVDGVYLEYPFEDRISEADWESGAFRKAK